MDKGINRAIKKYISSASKTEPGIVKAFLFGSYAKKNYREESDIDIALVIDHMNELEKFNIQVRLMLLAAKIDIRIEPHPISAQDLLSESDPFAVEIKRTGIEYKLI